MKRIAFALAATALASSPATAQSLEEAVGRYLDGDAAAWAAAPVVMNAVIRQNALTEGYSQVRIDKLDSEWRASVSDRSSPLIEGVLTGAAADYLRDQVERNAGEVVEIIVMDARGLNAAASAATSDYWQGDEAKFTETFERGANAFHVGQVEFDDSTLEYQVQVSRTITDVTGAPIGAMTIGLDIDALM